MKGRIDTNFRFDQLGDEIKTKVYHYPPLKTKGFSVIEVGNIARLYFDYNPAGLQAANELIAALGDVRQEIEKNLKSKEGK